MQTYSFVSQPCRASSSFFFLHLLCKPNFYFGRIDYISFLIACIPGVDFGTFIGILYIYAFYRRANFSNSCQPMGSSDSFPPNFLQNRGIFNVFLISSFLFFRCRRFEQCQTGDSQSF